MTKYTVVAGFWHKGLFLEAGSTVNLTEAEAKYRKHILLREVDAAPKAESTPAPKIEDVQTIGAEVVEKHTHHSRRRRKDAADDVAN